MKTFGTILSEARKAKGMSQKELAAQIKKEDGQAISPQYLNDIEHGRRNPPSEFLIGQIAKKGIVPRLEEFDVPFCDVGMGIQLTNGMLGGIVRVTTSTKTKREHLRDRVSFGDAAGGNEYNRNIQIAELNALNAALAVIKWKKLFGFYRDLKQEHHSQYSIDGNLLVNEDRPQ